MGAIFRFVFSFRIFIRSLNQGLISPFIPLYYILLYLSSLHVHLLFLQLIIDSLVNLAKEHHVDDDRAILFRT